MLRAFPDVRFFRFSVRSDLVQKVCSRLGKLYVIYGFGSDIISIWTWTWCTSNRTVDGSLHEAFFLVGDLRMHYWYFRIFDPLLNSLALSNLIDSIPPFTKSSLVTLPCTFCFYILGHRFALYPDGRDTTFVNQTIYTTGYFSKSNYRLVLCHQHHRCSTGMLFGRFSSSPFNWFILVKYVSSYLKHGNRHSCHTRYPISINRYTTTTQHASCNRQC